MRAQIEIHLRIKAYAHKYALVRTLNLNRLSGDL